MQHRCGGGEQNYGDTYTCGCTYDVTYGEAAHTNMATRTPRVTHAPMPADTQHTNLSASIGLIFHVAACVASVSDDATSGHVLRSMWEEAEVADIHQV